MKDTKQDKTKSIINAERSHTRSANKSSVKDTEIENIAKKDIESAVGDKVSDGVMDKDGVGITADTVAQAEAEEVENIVTALSHDTSNKRVWEVDFLRGLAIIMVVWDHLMWDLHGLFRLSDYATEFGKWLYNFSVSYSQSNIRSTTHIAFIVCFAILSGISSSFSRNNLKRGIKMAIFAVLFSLVTYGLSIIIKDKSVVIVFNIIHVLSLCVLFWALCDFIWSKINSIKLKNWYVAFLLALALAFVIIGSCYMKEPLKESKLFFLVECGTLWKYSPGDSAPLLPYLGWFVFGALAGKLLYKEKKTLFPTVNSKYVSFFTMCGRYSLVIYFGSQVVMAGLTYVLVKFLHWL